MSLHNPTKSPSQGAGVLSAPERGAYLLLYLLLVLGRVPAIIMSGRFWAEEGSVFFSAACHRPWYLMLVTPSAGYLNLIPNLGAVIASHVVPLEWAPYATTLLGFAVQLLPAVILCTSSDEWIRSRTALLACLLVMATAPLAQELWLNTLQSQMFLTLSCGLILAMKCSQEKIEWLRRAVLLVAPLAGCTSTFLVPFFFLRSFREGSGLRIVQTCCIATGSLVQLMMFVLPSMGMEAGRPIGIDIRLLLSILFQKHILIPLCGTEAMNYGNAMFAAYNKGTPLVLPIVCAPAVLLALSVVAWRFRKMGGVWYLFPGLSIAIISYICALAPKSDLLLIGDGVRYAFAGQMLMTMFYISMSRVGSGATKILFTALTAWLLFVGICQYRHTYPYFSEGPSWREQVEEWKKDHTKMVSGWPAGVDSWKFPLEPPDDRRPEK